MVCPLWWIVMAWACPWALVLWGQGRDFFQRINLKKKGADATRDNDWTCPKCGNINFSFRTVCNMRKCNTPKPGSQAAKSEKNSKQKMPEGSWKCEKCNNINYPFRTKCNRQNCGADKPAESNKSPSPTPDEDNQWVLGHVWGLRRSRVVVQPCSMWVSESQSCRPHVAAVVELLYLPSNDLCQVVVLTAMVFEVSILFWCIMCQPALSGEDLQVGSGFCS